MEKSRSPWHGKTVLVTAGPTREYLDPIRFLTNASSGLMGFSIARTARDLGAKVIVVSGPCQVESSWGIRVIPVLTAAEMHRQVLRHYRKADAFVSAAAVGDWRFAKASPLKIKKNGAPLQITLYPNVDILADVARRTAGARRRPVLIGFALETDHLLTNARVKLRRKKLDMIVANKPDSLGLSSAHCTILDRKGNTVRLPPANKHEAARHILKHAENFL